VFAFRKKMLMLLTYVVIFINIGLILLILGIVVVEDVGVRHIVTCE